MKIDFRSIIDLSVPLDACASERVPIFIRRVSHEEGATEMCRIFGVSRLDLPESGGWTGEEVKLISHAGTHVDAPWHYGPLSGGLAAHKIDEVPLDWFIAPAVVLRFAHKEAAKAITETELRDYLQESNISLRNVTIVLLETGASRYWGTAKYPTEGVGLSADAVLWLCEQGVRVIGTDAFSLDVPFEIMRSQFAASHDPATIWPAHFAGHRTPYCQIEKLINLDKLPSTDFWVVCFPVKISGGSAGWTRAVALVP